MSRDLSTYSPEFQAFVRSICGCRRECEPVAFNQYSCALVESPFKSPQQQMAGTSKPRAECVPGCMAVVSAKTGAEQRAQEQYPEFPQHPAEAAEREESDGCKDGLADDGQARLSCTGKRTVSHGSDAGIDRAGKGVALAAALHPASAKCQQSDAVVSGGSQNRASEYPISPADSSQIQVFPQGHLAESGAGKQAGTDTPKWPEVSAGNPAPDSFLRILVSNLFDGAGVL